MIKNGQFYNECMTLDPNCLKLEEAFFRMKKVDMYMENTKMILDSESSIKIGENTIGEDNGLVLSVKSGKSKFSIGEELSWEGIDQKIKIGGFDRNGGNIIIGTNNWQFVQKDDFIYHNGKQLLRIPDGDLDEKLVDKLWEKLKMKVRGKLEDNIMDINGERYVEQMMINMILIEKISKILANSVD